MTQEQIEVRKMRALESIAESLKKLTAQRPQVQYRTVNGHAVRTSAIMDGEIVSDGDKTGGEL